MPGRIYTNVVTIGSVSIYEVTADPNSSLVAARGSLAVRSDGTNTEVWQNTDGASTWQIGISTAGLLGARHELWVDQQSEAQAENGTVLYPFTTLQAAINRAAALATSDAISSWLIHLAAGDYAEDIVVPGTLQLSIEGLLYGPLVMISPPSGSIVWQVDSGVLNLSTLTVNGQISIVDGAAPNYGTAILENIDIYDDIIHDPASSAGVSMAIRGQFNSFGGGMGGGLPFTCNGRTSIRGDIILRNSSVLTVIGAEWTSSIISVSECEAFGCLIGSFGGSAFDLELGAWFRECSFTGTPTFTFAFPSGTLGLDENSYSSFLSNSGVISNGSRVNAWYDYIRSTLDDAPGTTHTIYVDNTEGIGNDGNTGAISSPFATLARAYQYCRSTPSLSYTVNVIPSLTRYSWPGMALMGWNWATIQCDLLLDATQGTLTISGVGASSQANGIVLTCTGGTAGAWAVDQFRGRVVKYVAGTGINGTFGTIYANTANTLSVTTDRRGTFTVPTVAGTIEIYSQQAQIQMPSNGACVIGGSVQLNFIGLKFTGFAGALSGGLFLDATDNVQFQRCRFDIDAVYAARGGSAELRNCYVRNDGTSGGQQQGMLSARTAGTLRLCDGTVVDGTAAAAASAAQACVTVFNATLEMVGEVVFQALKTFGVLSSGGQIVTNRIVSSACTARFLDSCTTAWRFNAHTTATGYGGSGDLPPSYGTISTAYAVVATKGSLVNLDSTSSLVTSGTTNAVSADNGITASTVATDGTTILPVGATPQPTTFSYAQAAPASNALVAVNAGLTSRRVFGTFTIAATAGNPASILIEVETGIGTGAYIAIGTFTQVATDTLARTYGYSFEVPGGRRYRMTKGALAGVTETFTTYNFADS